MDDQSLINTITGNNVEKANRDTMQFLRANPHIVEMLEDFRLIGTQALLKGAPANIENLAKIGFHPFNEAAIEIDLAVFFIQRGMYKSFYNHLRSFLELYIVATYFLSPLRTDEDAHEWLDGYRDTPSFSKTMLKKLFQEDEFSKAQDIIGLKERLQNTYWNLCHIVHSRGEPCGHKGVIQSNFPRFLEETFRIVIDDFRECIEVVCVTFSLRCPLILIGFPMMDKFGLGPPLSGFLDEKESEVIRKHISPDTLKFLDDFCETNDWFISARDWILSRPDLTESELRKQLEEMNESEREFRKGKGWKGSDPNLTADQMLFQMNTEYKVMKSFRDAKEKVDQIMKDLDLDSDD